MLLGNLQNVDHYVDDILIHTRTWEEHTKTLKAVLKKIDDAGLTIRPSKCKIAFSKIEFTGHVIGNGIVTTIQMVQTLYWPVAPLCMQTRQQEDSGPSHEVFPDTFSLACSSKLRSSFRLIHCTLGYMEW